MKANIDPKKVIAFFGGRTATQKRLKQARVPVSLKTIEKWKERGNIPTNRLAQLAMCALADGSKMDIYQFMFDTVRPASKATKPTKPTKPHAPTKIVAKGKKSNK